MNSIIVIMVFSFLILSFGLFYLFFSLEKKLKERHGRKGNS